MSSMIQANSNTFCFFNMRCKFTDIEQKIVVVWIFSLKIRGKLCRLVFMRTIFNSCIARLLKYLFLKFHSKRNDNSDCYAK